MSSPLYQSGIIDHVERVARDALFAVAIFGNHDFTAFELYDLDLGVSDDLIAGYEKRGLSFVGVTGALNGKPYTSFYEPLSAAAVDVVAAMYLFHFKTRLQQLPAQMN